MRIDFGPCVGASTCVSQLVLTDPGYRYEHHHKHGWQYSAGLRRGALFVLDFTIVSAVGGFHLCLAQKLSFHKNCFNLMGV